jgi:hypothetical protein
VSAANRASRRDTRRSPGRRHGWRRAWRLRSAHVRACEVRPVARRVPGDQGSSVSPPCDRVRGVPDHGEAVAARSIDTRRRGPAQEKGTKGPASPPGWRARVLGCTLARERRARVVTRANANASANSTARRHERKRHGAERREEQAKLECERALTKAAAPANDSTQPGTMAGITSGGAAARSDDTFPLGSKAGASTGAGKWSSSPWWPRAVVQASMKCGGATRRRGGRRR